MRFTWRPRLLAGGYSVDVIGGHPHTPSSLCRQPNEFSLDIYKLIVNIMTEVSGVPVSIGKWIAKPLCIFIRFINVTSLSIEDRSLL